MSKLLIRPLRDGAEAGACTTRLMEFGPWRTLGIPAEKLFTDLTHPRREVFVAELADRTAGVLILHLGGSFDGYIQLIAVFPEFQNRRLGEKIMRFAEEKIFRRSQNIFLCVSDFNLRAQAFYERLGYQKIGELKNFLVVGQNEILLRKTRGPLLEFSAQNEIMAAKMKRRTLPVALTIAGSDSGGGAGIQADLKTFAAFGVHGTSAIACLTAQNPRRVLAVEACSPKMLRQQIEAVFAELKPAAVKTGMLFSAQNISTVADFFRTPHSALRLPPLIVDPVMVSTSGARLLKSSAEKILREKLLPLAALVTPNLNEAEILAEQTILTAEDLRAAARKIYSRFGCAVLVKGGHLPNCREAIDVLFDGKTEWLLAAPFVKGVSTHGTGCTYSAAICAASALGYDLPAAVELGKNFITAAIANSYRVGKHFALGPMDAVANQVLNFPRPN